MPKAKTTSVRISKPARKVQKLIAACEKGALLDAVVLLHEVPEGTVLVTARLRLPYRAEPEPVLIAVSRLPV